MNWMDLKQSVIAEYDTRNLKSDVRYKALDKICSYLDHKYVSPDECFRKEKSVLKEEYEQSKGKCLNGAENSAFNELYNQYRISGQQ